MKNIYLIFLCFFTSTVWIWSGTADAENGQEVLSLEQCIDLVFTKSPELAFAIANKEEKQELWSASKKDLYPTLFADYSYLRQPGSSRTGFFSVPRNYYDYALTVKQPLYKGKALITTAKVNELEYKVSSSEIKQAKNNLLLTIHEDYFELLKAQKLQDEAH